MDILGLVKGPGRSKVKSFHKMGFVGGGHKEWIIIYIYEKVK